MRWFALPIRRRQLIFRGTLLAGAAAATYARFVEPRWCQWIDVPMPIAGLPEFWRGRTVVQISDTHVGDRVNSNYLRAEFAAVEFLRPDLVVFTGDFIDSISARHVDAAIELMDAFPRGSIGNATVLGNHDYGRPRFLDPVQTARLVDAMRTSNLNPLVGESIEFRGLRIVGLPDLWRGQFKDASVAELIGDDGRPTITLSHNPDSADRDVWRHHCGWILCGHTHGGQCSFPIVGAPIVPVKNRNYVAGVYPVNDATSMYINRGLGHTAPVRFGVRPEITRFVLSAA